MAGDEHTGSRARRNDVNPREPRVFLLLAVLALHACTSGAHGPSVAVGTPCVDGYTCAPDLICFIPDADPDAGTCVEPPSACGGRPSCDCLGELEQQCETPLVCIGIAEQYTAACSIGDDYRQEGESCAAILPCGPGLLCFIPVFDEPGVCEPEPACFEDPSLNPCECLGTVAEARCASGSGSCIVVGDFATLQCG
jgi:hypothetical protein